MNRPAVPAGAKRPAQNDERGGHTTGLCEARHRSTKKLGGSVLVNAVATHAGPFDPGGRPGLAVSQAVRQIDLAVQAGYDGAQAMAGTAATYTVTVINSGPPTT